MVQCCAVSSCPLPNRMPRISCALMIGSLGAALVAATVGGCVPRERPEDKQGKAEGQHKAPRATTVASREEIPEDPGAIVQDRDAQAALPAKPKHAAPAMSASATAASSSRPEVKPSREPPQLPSAQPAPSNGLAEDPLLSSAFEEEFARSALGANWQSTSPQWRTENGRLCVKNARNHPVWLKRRLPKNARIEFTATSYSDDGDIKVEMWGDGRSAAAGTSYNDATGYLAIFGGWQNHFHVLARLDEHAPNRPEIKLVPDGDDPRALPVENGTEYSFRIERVDGKTIRWIVDDIELFAFQDKAPLSGPGHDHFAFNNWQVRVCFDDLKIVPLP